MQKDPTPVDVDTSKPNPAYRPNLSQSMYVGNDDDRILSSLKMPAYEASQTSAAPKKSLLKLAVLTLAGGAVAFVGYQYLVSQPKKNTPPVELAMAGTVAGKKSNPVIEEKAEPVAPATAPLAAAPAPAAPAPVEAAQIINEAPAAKAPVAANEAKLTQALEEGVKPPKAALQKALEVKSPAAGATAAATATTAPKIAADSAAPKAASPAPAKAAPATATTAQKKTTSDAEKDINLIAALLTHNNAAVGAPAAKPNSLATEPKKSAASTTANANVTASAAADKTVVAAAPGTESTEVLLKQCAELGFIEREVCKMKTCSNQWNTDAACKAALPSAK